MIEQIFSSIEELVDGKLVCGAGETLGVRPHKEKINISKEIINKTRGAEAPYTAQIFTHLSVVSSRQRSYDWLRCEGLKNEMEM